jgi:hypothetical protein
MISESILEVIHQAKRKKWALGEFNMKKTHMFGSPGRA